MRSGLRPILRRTLQALGAAYPFYSGYGRLASMPLPLGLLSDLPGEVWVRTRRGAKLLVVRDDLIGRSVYYFGDLDRKLTTLLKRILRPGDTFVDIGANIGLVTMEAAAMVGPQGKIYSFEPQPAVAGMMQRSLTANAFNWVHLQRYGLGSASRTVTLHVPAGNAGGASQHRTDGAGEDVRVEIRDARQVFAELGIARPRLIKIDVEGAELEILEVCAEPLRAAPAEFIVCETNDVAEKYWQQPLTRLLAGLDYQIYGVVKEIFTLRLFPIDMSRQDAITGHDVVAVHRSADLAPLRSAIRP